MQQILLFTLLGLGSGALIAGIALGVVLTYRGSGIINLATGGMAMFAGYAFWALTTDLLHLSTVPALLISLVIVLAVGAAIELVAFRPLRTAPPLAKLVSSLGVLLVLQASMLLAFGTTQQPEPNVLPQNTVKLLGAVIPIDRFILTGIVIVLAAALSALYRFTRFGLQTRAASENEVAAMLGGLSPNRLSMVNTLLASAIAGGIGILAASITQLDTETLPLQIVPALAAALIAGFTSFGIACAAGIGLGIIGSLLQYVTALSWFPTAGGVALPGVYELVVFVLIVAFMYLRGASLPTRGELVEQRLPEAPRPRKLAVTAPVFVVVCAVALVVFPFDFREALVNTMIGTLIALSLVVITGFVGQISVVQLTLAGVSGFAISHLAVNAGIGFPLAPLLGAGVALILGLITAASALRVRGVSLAVVTLAAVVAITNFGFVNTTWGGGQTGSPVPEPTLLGLDLGPRAAFRGLDGNLPSPVFGWVVLAVTVAVCVAGRARAPGVARPAHARGALQRARRRGVGDRPARRQIRRIRDQLGDRRSRRCAVRVQLQLGQRRPVRSVHRAEPDRVRIRRRDHADLGRGVRRADLDPGAVPVRARQVVRHQRQLVPAVRRRDPDHHADPEPRGRGRRVLQEDAQATRGPPARAGHDSRGPRCARRPWGQQGPSGPSRGRPTAPPGDAPRPGTRGLRAVGRVRRRARAQRGRSRGPRRRARRPDRTERRRQDHADRRGHRLRAVHRAGRARRRRTSASLPAYQRARRGLARTWQNTDLFDDLEVGENVAVAAAGPLRGGTPDRADGTDTHPEQVLELVDLGWAVDAMPDELPEGTRKLVGVARALAGDPRLLCLDEPAAGLDARESEELGRRLRGLADQGQTTLLIDHDMGLVLGICDRVVVLEFGRVIADGPPETVRRDERVIAAYLGSGGNAAAAAVDVTPVASEAETSTGGSHEST